MRTAKLIVATLMGLAISTPAFAATAFWTGKMEQVQTVTYRYVWRCEYNYNGQLFYRLFERSCPSTVEVS